ncbi:MAG: HDIG domain-containing metalloprotein [Candidatus Bathyarchaeia archaeon]
MIKHCEAVAQLATETAQTASRKGLQVNVELVEIGALLHDIGRSRTHSVHHVVEGAQIAEAAGLPENVVSIIKRHVGGGITDAEAERLGWPRDNYAPVTLEEKIVSYADKLIETSERVPIQATINKLKQENLGDAAEKVRLLHEEIAQLIGEGP